MRGSQSRVWRPATLLVQKSAVDEKRYLADFFDRVMQLVHVRPRRGYVFMNENVKMSARSLGAENDVRRRIRANIIDSVTPEELIRCYRRWGGDHSLKPPEGGSPLTPSGL